jgi:hypothetical protein
MKMGKMRIIIVIGLLALVGALVPAQAALAAPDQGTIEWGKDKTYWPSEGDARYWITYPTVDITDIRPGSSNEFRLTIGNLTGEPITLDISVVALEEDVMVAAESKTLPEDWVSFTEGSSEDSAEVSAAALHTIPENSSLRIWCHVDVPKDRDLLEDTYQCAIKVTEESGGVLAVEGPESVVTVRTADELSGAGQKNAMWIFLVLVLFILAVGGGIYFFSRWRWPNEPKPQKELETGLNPEDWKE